jgi:hypothetical protein
MGGYYESFQDKLGKPVIQIAAAAGTLLFAIAAVFLDLVALSACIVASCLAALSLVTLCASFWFGRISARRHREAELKRRDEAERRAEASKPKTDVMSEAALKVLRFFVYNEHDLSLEDIKMAFKLDTTGAQNEVDDLQKRGFLRQTTIAGIGSDAASYTLTPAGRAHAMKNMFA